jgi:hypothetical protein
MGYYWVKNIDPSLRFDAFIFRQAVIAAIKIKKIRYAVDENAFVENLFLKKLKHCVYSPTHRTYFVSSGYGHRTSGLGAGSISCRIPQWRLSSILLKTTVTPISTRRSGGMHHSVLIPPYHLIRGTKSDKPVKGSVWQTDEDKISLYNNGVHSNKKYLL